MGRPRLARTFLYLSNRRVAVSLSPYAHYAAGTDGTTTVNSAQLQPVARCLGCSLHHLAEFRVGGVHS